MLIAFYEEDEYATYSDWVDFKQTIEEHLKDRKFPLQLIAENSNWRGQTGYATVESIDGLIIKITSFKSSYYELHKTGNSYEFRLSTHDVPMGFTVKIRSF